jgi:alkyl hydroperoxide reductase subunit AhpC
MYAVYAKRRGVTERALFVIDKHGIIRWSYVSPIEINPGAEGILKALESRT